MSLLKFQVTLLAIINILRYILRYIWILEITMHHPSDRHHGRRSLRKEFDKNHMMRGRKFTAEELQLLLLNLIAQSPSHGYELIKELQERTEGSYNPSPGMVYPALTYLEERDLIISETHKNKKNYTISTLGTEYLGLNKPKTEELFACITHLARKMHYIRNAMNEEANEPPDAHEWLPEFVEARLALKRALLMKSGVDQEKQKVISVVLNKAAAEINKILS